MRKTVLLYILYFNIPQLSIYLLINYLFKQVKKRRFKTQFLIILKDI